MQLQINQRLKLPPRRSFLELSCTLASKPGVVTLIQLSLWDGRAVSALTGFLQAANRLSSHRAAQEGSDCGQTLNLEHKPPTSWRLSWSQNTWKHFSHFPHVSARLKKSSGCISSTSARSLQNENRTLNLVLMEMKCGTSKALFPASLAAPGGHLPRWQHTADPSYSHFHSFCICFFLLAANLHSTGNKNSHCNFLQGLKMKLVFAVVFHIHKQLLFLSLSSPFSCI